MKDDGNVVGATGRARREVMVKVEAVAVGEGEVGSASAIMRHGGVEVWAEESQVFQCTELR